jgi:hypothetical protein
MINVTFDSNVQYFVLIQIFQINWRLFSAEPFPLLSLCLCRDMLAELKNNSRICLHVDGIMARYNWFLKWEMHFTELRHRYVLEIVHST